jgi:hypothetical protein
MVKRLTRKLSDVAQEVERQLKAHYNVTQKDLDSWRTAARLSQPFPQSKMVAIKELWIDYEVQRDVLHKHIINIMKKWDSRICSPVSACQFVDSDRIDTYDGQHRTISAAILGFEEIPCAVVITDDKNFASFAFEMLNDTGVKRLTPGDLHRNALVRYKNGSRDLKVVHARTMQDQFDKLGIDLQDKGSRSSENLRGENDYFFSHFKYAQKGLELDANNSNGTTGTMLYNILDAIKSTFPLQEEIDQGVFIGLYELQRITGTAGNIKLPQGWMIDVLKSAKKVFSSSHLVHAKAKVQWEYSHPGAGWNAPLAMSNFLRELHVLDNGKINLPYHGAASKTGIENGNVAPGLFPQREAA